MNPELQKFIRFSIVGLSNSVIDLGLLNILVLLSANPYLASSLSFIIAATNGYILNRLWTFGDSKSQYILRQYALFMLSNTIGLVLNNAIVYMFLTYFQLGTPTLTLNGAKIVAIILVVAWNYSASRWYIFRPLSGKLSKSPEY